MGGSRKKAAKAASKAASRAMKNVGTQSAPAASEPSVEEYNQKREGQMIVGHLPNAPLGSMKALADALGEAPKGQAAPPGAGMTATVAETVAKMIKKGDNPQDYMRVDAIMKHTKQSDTERTRAELGAFVAEHVDDDEDCIALLWNMLNWTADAINPIVGEMDDEFGDNPLVEVRETARKGDGVFAKRFIPAGKFFTTYPCCGLAVPRGSLEECHASIAAGNGGDGMFVAPEMFPISAAELNLKYAINTPITNDAGRAVQVVGHAANRHGMACGHLINDAFTVEQVGGTEMYNAMDGANCTAAWCMGSVLMRTTRDVPAGQELLFSYGATYWTDEPNMTLAPVHPIAG